MRRIIWGLKTRLMKEEDVLVRFLVTDVNEHFHAEMRNRFKTGMMTVLEFQRKLFQVIDSSLRSQSYPGFHIPHTLYTMYQKPTPSNDPSCSTRIVVPRPTRKPKLTDEDWAKLAMAMVAGSKEVLRTVAPRKVTCTQKATYESMMWRLDSERIATAARDKREGGDGEEIKGEALDFNYGDIVLVDVAGLPIAARHAGAVCFCVIREDVVRQHMRTQRHRVL